MNSIVGTPLYLAPEAVLTPDRVDARADIYALGGVGYYLLTATPVFQGTSAMEVCAQHLHSAPEPPSLRLGQPLPSSLERLLLRCLAKKPEDRPQSAAALSAELEALGVPPWTQEQARAWWREYGERIEPRSVRRSQNSPLGAAVTIDVQGRAALG